MKFTSLLVPVAALVVSLWLFVIYRSEHCVVNVMLGGLLPTGTFSAWRGGVRAWLPLPGDIIYRLPGGLWVFAATVIAKNGYVMLKGIRLNLAQLPVAIAIGLELLQGCGVTDGTFDRGDIVAELAGFVVASRLIGCAWPPLDLSRGWHWRGALCLGSYVILFLADVIR